MSHPFADMLREVVAGTRVDPGQEKAKPEPKPKPKAEPAAPAASRRKGNSASSKD